MVRRNDNDVEATANRRWHFEKSISIGHLLTTLSIGGSVMVWAMSMETRIAVLENAVTYGKENGSRIERDVRDKLGEVNASLVRIEAKLDDKVDKRR